MLSARKVLNMIKPNKKPLTKFVTQVTINNVVDVFEHIIFNS